MTSPFDWKQNRGGMADALKKMEHSRRCSEGTRKWVDQQRAMGKEPSIKNITKAQKQK